MLFYRENAGVLCIIPVLRIAAVCFCVLRFAETAPSEQSAVQAARGFEQPEAAAGGPCGWEPYDRPSH